MMHARKRSFNREACDGARAAARALLEATRAALPVRYAYEALVINEFEHVRRLRITTSIGDNPTIASQWLEGTTMLRCLGFDPDAKLSNIGSLLAWLVCGLVALGLLLRFQVREAR